MLLRSYFIFMHECNIYLIKLKFNERLTLQPMKLFKKVIAPVLVSMSLGLSLYTNVSFAQTTTTIMNKSSVIQQINEDSVIDWAKNVVKVTGSGAPPDRGNQAQKRLMAVRAAKADAFRQLVEIINGVHVNSETVVKDFVTESDVIKTKVEGLIKGAELVGEPRYMSDGSVEVDLQIKLFGKDNSVASVIRPQEQSDDKPDTKITPANVSEMYTSVIIDCKGLGALPAMSPSLVDENGGEVYYGNLPVDPDFVINEGIVSYASSISDAKNNSRAGANPLMIKGTKVLGLFKSDITITNNDAKKLLGANEKTEFLKNSKVIMII